MKVFIFFLQVLCVTAQTIIKAGLLIPKDDPDLFRDCGMYGSLGAIPLAIDRIVKEDLLRGFNFSFHIYNDECENALAAGYAAQMMEKDDIDVIFGPVCNAPATIVGSLGRFYDIPIMTWGLVNTNQLTNNEKYPTTSMITGTSLMLGKAVVEILKQFDWNQFAFLYATTNSKNRCSFVREDIESVVNDQEDIFISYQRAIKDASLNNLKIILNIVKSKSRIIFCCYEKDYEKRNHLLALYDLGMTSDDYVNVFVELRGLGFGSRYASSDTSRTLPFWTIGSSFVEEGQNVDNRDSDAKAGARTSFVLDFQTSTFIDLQEFSDGVMTRAQSWPFYCGNCSETYYNASTYSRYLHDSFYLYSLGLNRTLKSPNDTDAVRRGSEIIKNARGSFTGATGVVDIGVNGTRDSTFFLTGMKPDFSPSVFLTVSFSDGEPTLYLNYSDPATTIWEMRSGKLPRDIPICGFDGESCPAEFWRDYAGYVFGGISVVLVLIGSVIIYSFYYRNQQTKILNKLWQISFMELEKPQKKTGFQSERSLQSKHSNSTRMTLESMTETKNYSYFYFRHEPVAGRKFKTKIILQENDTEELRKMTQLDSDNCNRFIGLCMDGPQYIAIWKYCNRGSLKDVITKGSYTMDAFFVLSIMRDLANGLGYLHGQTFLRFHGRMTSKNCVVDDRWVVKISDFGFQKLISAEKRRKLDYLWVAPELIRSSNDRGSQPGDIYSYAIICSEVLTRKPPFDYENRRAGIDELIYLIRKGGSSMVRPDLSDIDIPDLNAAVLHLIRDCWAEDPESRPNITQVRTLIKSMSGRSLNLMDHIFSVLEQYAETLAEEVTERTKELVEEKKKSDILLYRMLPRQVADSLKAGRSVEPENFESVTIFFSDVVQFTTLASKCTPLQVVNLLNDLYVLFDSYIETHDVYKVETIGDGYLCVSGLPHRNGNEHAKEIASLSLDMMKAVKSFRISHLPNERVNIRIGAHTGACTAGVVGLAMPRYCLFGDSVNTASRMESNGKPSKIHISAELNSLLEILGGFVTELRGEVIIKGKGVMQTYWLISRIDPNNYTQERPILHSNSPTTNPEEITFNQMEDVTKNSMYNQFLSSQPVNF